ncbi:MAG: hypothetical protein LW884_02175 [Bacteroidetes bacterium]|jgi:hypothetical protein|nr:hypothetical protein [Bacteroidota bacterium]
MYLLRLLKPWWPPLLLGSLLVAYMANNMTWFGPYGGPIGYLLLIAGLLAWLWRQPTSIFYLGRTQPNPQLLGTWLAGAALGMLLVVGLVAANPLDVAKGDIVLVVQVYVQRLLAGDVVYQMVTVGPNNVYEAGYLLFHWLPFVPAELLGIDYRIAAFCYFQLALLVAGFRLLGGLPGRWPLVLMVATQVVVLLLIRLNPNVHIYTIEPLIYGYYLLLLVWGLGSNRWLAVLAFLLCLLSRYSLVFWVPAALVVVLRLHGWRHTLWVFGLTLVGLAVFFLLFLVHDPLVVLRSLQSYTTATVNEWTYNTSGGRPVHLYFGRGLALYFYEWGNGSILARIQSLQTVHLLVTATSGLLLALGAFFVPRNKLYGYGLLGLAVYHALFLSFLQLPYSYLFGTNFWWCWGLLLWAVRGKLTTGMMPVQARLR